MKKNIISAILLAALSLVLVFALCAPAFASDSQPSDQASEPAVLSAPTETAEDKTVSTKAVAAAAVCRYRRHSRRCGNGDFNRKKHFGYGTSARSSR